MKVNRTTVDTSAYPDMVVVYIGMRVNRPRGFLRLLGLGPKLIQSHKAGPDGLLLHEDIVWSIFPPHWGARQYWRDLDSLERWTRSDPHQQWWRDFLKDAGGTGFWHEAYFMRGGIDTMYDDMSKPTGMARFAPTMPSRGRVFSTRKRVEGKDPRVAPVVSEDELYG